jgi:hypothetical protein
MVPVTCSQKSAIHTTHADFRLHNRSIIFDPPDFPPCPVCRGRAPLLAPFTQCLPSHSFCFAIMKSLMTCAEALVRLLVLVYFLFTTGRVR